MFIHLASQNIWFLPSSIVHPETVNNNFGKFGLQPDKKIAGCITQWLSRSKPNPLTNLLLQQNKPKHVYLRHVYVVT